MAPDRYSFQSDVFAPPSRAQKAATMLRNWGHRVASLPLINMIPLLSMPAAIVLTGVAALLESGDSLFRGNVVESTKQLMSGAVDTAATATMTLAGGALFWLANPFSWIITGNSIPENLRQGSQALLDMFDNDVKQPDPRTLYARNNAVLGMTPRTIGMNMAGVGFAPTVQRQLDPYRNNMAPANYFTDTIAQQRGIDPEQARANWMKSDENRMSHQELLAAAREQQSMGSGANRS